MFGSNRMNQCNIIPNICSHILKVSLGERHTLVLYNNGTVRSFGDNSFGQCNLDVIKNADIKDIACG